MDEPTPKEEWEIAELREKYAVDPVLWAKVVEQERAKERERRRRLFGDREPFAIPDGGPNDVPDGLVRNGDTAAGGERPGQSLTVEAEVLPRRVSDVGSARLAVIRVQPRQRRIELVVMPDRAAGSSDPSRDDSRTLWLIAGELFPIGAETWQVAELMWRTVDDWRVVVRRLVDVSNPPPPRIEVRDAVRVPVDPFGSLDEAALQGLERRLGRRLPPQYRRWLARTNGARPTGLAQVYGHAFLPYPERPLFGVHPDEPMSDLAWAEDLRRAWLTEDYVVIARPDGGLLAVQVTGWVPDTIWSLPEAAFGETRGWAGAGFGSVAEYLCARALRFVAWDIQDLLLQEGLAIPQQTTIWAFDLRLCGRQAHRHER